MDQSGETARPFRVLPRGGAAEQILEDLRARILEGELLRGARLPTEKQPAQGYGVSGRTVREAIRGLTTANLIALVRVGRHISTASVPHLRRKIALVERVSRLLRGAKRNFARRPPR